MAATTGAGTGARAGDRRDLASKILLIIRWSLSSEYLIMKKLAEPEATSGATIDAGMTAQIGARDAAGAGVQ